jgi:hypothetical protein
MVAVGFHDIHEIHPSPITTEALDRIGALYGIEREIRGQTAEQRREIRQARAKPLLDQFHRWLEEKLTTLSAKSDTAAAIRCALSRWRALTRYLDDGLIENDNSSAERALRAVALGRRNYLFAGADSGGDRAANIYSLVGSAKLNGLDPEFYLRHVLTRIAQYPINLIDDLLPWNIQTDTVSASPAYLTGGLSLWVSRAPGNSWKGRLFCVITTLSRRVMAEERTAFHMTECNQEVSRLHLIFCAGSRPVSRPARYRPMAGRCCCARPIARSVC